MNKIIFWNRFSGSYRRFFVPVIAVVIVGITSCSSDPLEGSGSYTSSVSVISQDVSFDAQASQGTIQFSAPGASYAYATSEWCKTTLNGNSIIVSAIQNNSRNSRSCDVIIKCGTDSATVNVIQKGFIFSVSAGNTVVRDGDEATTVSYGFSENLDFHLTPSEKWFSATIDGDYLSITFDENDTGHIRKGYLYYTAGDARDSLNIIQYDFSKDIAGPAYMYFKDSKGTLYHTNIVLAENYFTLPDFAKYGDWKVPFTFNAEKMQFSFANAQDVGMYNNTYYVSDIIFGSGYFSTYKSVSWDAYINYDAKQGYFKADMVDNASWSYPFEGFYLRAFNSTTYSSSTDVGAITQFYAPYIIRFDNTSSAKGQNVK